MDKEINEIIDKIKDSANNPTIMIPSYDGSDEEEFINDAFINPIESKILLDYIVSLQQQLKKKQDVIEKLKKYIQENCYKYYGSYNDKQFDILEDLDLILELKKQKTEQLQQENAELKSNYERIYNENCKLREKHNINDISLLDENEELKKQLDEVVHKATEYESEVYELKKQLEELKQPQIFMDTQDIEEKYGEELYQKHLEKENQQLKIQISAMEEKYRKLENSWNGLKN